MKTTSSISSRGTLLPGVIAVWWATVTVVQACCMVPRTYQGTIQQNTQEAVLLHAEGRQELILGIDYRISPGSSGKLPDAFAWIITVPNEPDRYQLAQRSLFKDVFQWGERRMHFQYRSKSLSPQNSSGGGALVWSPQVKVGPYTIQPVKATGMAALKDLNRWLGKNGFPQEEEEHMRYFVEKGFTFLCIKVNAAKAGAAVPAHGPLKPLHLSFRSERPYYPLRFSSRQGVFGINVWMLTQQSIDLKKSGSVYKQLGLSAPVNWLGKLDSSRRYNVEVTKDQLPKSLKGIVASSPAEPIRKNIKWKMNLLRADAVNKRVMIKDWKSDVFFPLVPQNNVESEAESSSQST